MFDRDGVLIDSEPLWLGPEVEVFGALGVPLTEAMCLETTGLRLDEVVDHRYRRHPWPDLDAAAVATAVVARIAALIEAVVQRFGLEGSFEVVRTADHEPHGKPHPAIDLSTAEQLGVAPTACEAIEDQVDGIVAAKAARMACVAVPAPELRGDRRRGVADVVLDSLHALSADGLERLVPA